MAWETYTRQVIRTGEPVVSIGKLGRLAMNLVATNIFRENQVTHVALMWDKEEHKCAVKAVSSKEPGAYKLTFNPKYNGSGLSVVTFLNYIRYDWTETRAFNAEWDEVNKMFVFDIPKEHFGTNGEINQKDQRSKSGSISTAKEKEATEVTS